MGWDSFFCCRHRLCQTVAVLDRSRRPIPLSRDFKIAFHRHARRIDLQPDQQTVEKKSLRDAPRQWLHDLYGFAIQPDLVFYLKIGVQDLVPRVLEAGKMNYWESGMDMNYGDDLYDSFVAYQGALIEQFDRMPHCLPVRLTTHNHSDEGGGGLWFGHGVPSLLGTANVVKAT